MSIPIGEFRSPKRIVITLSHGTYQGLIDRSDQTGQSPSKLAAFLLELERPRPFLWCKTRGPIALI
ncbi:MAG: hypothetical protein FJ077_04715 [Cyanobacteria bacterium K_DeepCast_35m_m2_023]|nr:hypothetical protein [Cyanobacteria bacterium K_DeepCast_35m_m2_023]